ncbi:beta-ketoacyl-[acyl-carrier-protein] synthase family protein [Pseudoclavibacter sp. CFCC 13611]|uniref:beta-ketoacyl-[acyl-carrier-protein] synthase family protein n=1 Tax=Pseudoclavibacter sp. CFCC 13611 TaxID=2615178 RepID=UPI001CE3E6BF|nr:beta-ketoacyl-[acyl-carrier-protein] synthase family protein [Pseudoclavibacter sp. CFCC 13611]
MSTSSRPAVSAPQNGARRPVFVSGFGAVTPCGLDAETTWQAVLAGRSGVGLLHGPDGCGGSYDDLTVRIGGQVRDFEASSVLPPHEARRLSRVLWWAIAAADEALAHAGSAGRLPGAPRAEIIVGTGSGPIETVQQQTRALDARGPRGVTPYVAMHGAPDAAGALLSMRYGLHGPTVGLSATCASGAVALGEAMRRIRHGYADAVLVVGMEDCLNAVNLSANARMRALAAGYEADPASACRPFDRARSGFVMAQGAAAVLLESGESLRARGGRPLAELAGYGASSDAWHATAPDPEARGAAQAIDACLQDAGVAPRDVDHVNAHGTGTPLNDSMEVQALDRALGAAAQQVPITSTKSSTGHLLGASGVLEAVFAVQTLRDRVVPPTINLDESAFPDHDIVTGQARPVDVRTVLSNSFGFGGHNASLLLRRASALAPRRPRELASADGSGSAPIQNPDSGPAPDSGSAPNSAPEPDDRATSRPPTHAKGNR